MKVKGFGDITIAIFPEVAPITAKNFLKLVNDKFYDGLIFHRVIKGFMIQGGDPTGTGSGGSKQEIKGEFALNGFNNPLKHKRGVISMARTNDPNSASSQFFIMHKDAPHLDGGYAAFGEVVSGIEVVDKIATTRTDYYDRPIEDVVIESVRVI
ncbi:MAG: peptidylprolyl isomerase [Acholeplasmatales bacterium]|nr:peptidylprolyl isomerase [Acholeplasmatales bacterium]